MSNKPGPSSRLSRQDILRAAYRYYELEETQADIAADLGISTGYLARRLKKARRDGWVRFYVDVSADSERAARLKSRFEHLVEVEVVPEDAPDGVVSAMSQVLARWLNDLLAAGPDDDAFVEAVATGGGTVHTRMLDRVLPREEPCDVGPTALSPLNGGLHRWPASTVAAVLSFRLHARSRSSRAGTLYDVSIEPSPDDFRRWWKRLRAREGFGELRAFWHRTDIVFCTATTLDNLYDDVAVSLERLDLTTESLADRGVVGICANQFFDAEARRVDLDEGVPSYVPAMPLENVAEKAAARRDGDRRKSVILDVRQKQAPAARHLVEAGLVTHLVTDTAAADIILSEPR